MGSPPRRPPASLAAKLLEEGSEFAFFQAVRLLQQAGDASLGYFGPVAQESLRLRGYLSLCFPRSDVVGIEEVERSPGQGTRFELQAPFLALYGSDSPLPAYMTEEILWSDDDEGDTVREFLDILNHRLLSLLYRTWSRYRLHIQQQDWQQATLAQQLAELIGQPRYAGRRTEQSLWSCAGLLLQRPHSASGLRQLLDYHLPGMNVQIEQCVPRLVPVPKGQRIRLGKSGSTVAKDMVLGRRVLDRTTKFRVVLYLQGGEQFARYQAGSPGLERLRSLVELWNEDCLAWDVRLCLQREDVTPIRLDTRRANSKLGVNSWLGRPKGAGTELIVDPAA